MMINEFNDRVTDKVNADQYASIEMVYEWYPVELNKDQIAILYERFGMTLINDMLPRAKKNLEISSQIEVLRRQLRDLKEKQDELREGRW